MRVGVGLDTVLVRYVVEPERFSDCQLSSSVRSTDLFHGLSAVTRGLGGIPSSRAEGSHQRAHLPEGSDHLRAQYLRRPAS
jgi:hypothetical protein